MIAESLSAPKVRTHDLSGSGNIILFPNAFKRNKEMSNSEDLLYIQFVAWHGTKDEEIH